MQPIEGYMKSDNSTELYTRLAITASAVAGPATRIAVSGSTDETLGKFMNRLADMHFAIDQLYEADPKLQEKVRARRRVLRDAAALASAERVAGRPIGRRAAQDKGDKGDKGDE